MVEVSSVRILGEIWCFDTNVNKKMIEEHHAVVIMDNQNKRLQNNILQIVKY